MQSVAAQYDIIKKSHAVGLELGKKTIEKAVFFNYSRI